LGIKIEKILKKEEELEKLKRIGNDNYSNSKR